LQNAEHHYDFTGRELLGEIPFFENLFYQRKRLGKAAPLHRALAKQQNEAGLSEQIQVFSDLLVQEANVLFIALLLDYVKLFPAPHALRLLLLLQRRNPVENREQFEFKASQRSNFVPVEKELHCLQVANCLQIARELLQNI